MRSGRPGTAHEKGQGVVGDQGQSRERLAGIFWGDSPEKQARANLRQALSSLRQALDGAADAVLLTDPERVSLREDALELDVSAFERLAAEATPEALSQATKLYRGDLLDGFSLREESFETWAMAERERLRDRFAPCAPVVPAFEPDGCRHPRPGVS